MFAAFLTIKIYSTRIYGQLDPIDQFIPHIIFHESAEASRRSRVQREFTWKHIPLSYLSLKRLWRNSMASLSL